MKDRIRPPANLEAILDAMKDEGVFETKQKGMMLAAAIGYASEGAAKGGKEIESPGEGIRMEYFDNASDVGFIDALAVAHTEDLSILDESRQEERIDIFERYAHAGLIELKHVCYDQKQGGLEGVLQLLDKFGDQIKEGSLPGLEAEVKKLDKLL